MYAEIFKLQSRLLKALAHPRRLEIIQLLRDKELNVSSIYRMLDLPQANVSQHLTVLREAGLITSRKLGKQIFYRVADKRFVRASDLIREILVETNRNGPLKDELTLSMNELLPIFHDPVCQMRVSPKTAGFAHKHEEKTYYFCASGCYHAFKKNPKKYVK